DSLGHAVERADQEAAADQAALDSLHGRDTTRAATLTDSAPAPAVRGEDVAREAERLFGPEGRAAVGAAATPGEPLFDIDVTTFAANRRVLEYLEFFQVDARDRFEIWLSRLGRYEGMIRERLRARGLPEDLVYLTLIESGLSNTAVSRARAVGMWQFIAGTARLYGLTVDPWVDERRDPYRATGAAVSYLSDLVQRLGSVYLAAAAYNAGAGRIERGVARLPGELDTLPATARITFVDHYVALGQTLSEIARRYRVTVAMIQSANPRLSARALRPGQRIIIPMSGRIVPPAAWSIPPEPRYRRILRGS